MLEDKQPTFVSIRVGKYEKVVQLEFTLTGAKPTDLLKTILKKARGTTHRDPRFENTPPFADMVGKVIKTCYDYDVDEEDCMPHGKKGDTFSYLERIEMDEKSGEFKYIVLELYAVDKSPSSASTARYSLADFKRNFIKEEVKA